MASTNLILLTFTPLILPEFLMSSTESSKERAFPLLSVMGPGCNEHHQHGQQNILHKSHPVLGITKEYKSSPQTLYNPPTGYVHKMRMFLYVERCHENHIIRISMLQIAPTSLVSSTSGFELQIHSAHICNQKPRSISNRYVTTD